MTRPASTAMVFLDAARTGKLEMGRLPATLTLDQGLRTQIDVLGLRTASGEELGGWKVGLTSGPNRDRMGTGFRPFGYVLRSRIFRSGSEISLGQLAPGAIEAELAFEIGRSLSGPDVTSSAAAAAIAGVRPAFELNQRRAPRPCDPGIQIADDLSQWGIVIGDLRQWAPGREVTPVTLARDSEPVETTGPDYAIDAPVLALRRVCASLHRVGLGLEPGQQVITGAFCRATLDQPGEWAATFSGAGTVRVRFS